MTSDRKKPAAGFWINAVLPVALAFYVASFGPACWLVSRMPEDYEFFRVMYFPVGRLGMGDVPDCLGDPVRWYGELMMRRDSRVTVYAVPDGSSGIILSGRL